MTNKILLWKLKTDFYFSNPISLKIQKLIYINRSDFFLKFKKLICIFKSDFLLT